MATILGVKDGLGLSIGPSLEGIITFKSMSREARHQGDGRWFLDPMLTVMLCCFKAFQGGPRLFNVLPIWPLYWYKIFQIFRLHRLDCYRGKVHWRQLRLSTQLQGYGLKNVFIW